LRTLLPLRWNRNNGRYHPNDLIPWCHPITTRHQIYPLIIPLFLIETTAKSCNKIRIQM
jgi:hypothetical protein